MVRNHSSLAVQVGVARIDAHRIGFTHRSAIRGGGVADLVAAPGRVVWGALHDPRQRRF